MPPEFSIRSDSVDVDEIMTQIRARIREKRGVDYTEEELRQLASVKLEKFLDPTRVRSDLVQHYQKARQSGGASMLVPPPENYAFDDHLVYGSARGGSGGLISSIRRLLNPVLKLFINPNPIIYVLHRQSLINTHNEEQFVRVERVAALNYEVLHNLVRRADAPLARGQEPQDAGRVGVGPPGLQRPARAGARERRAVPAGHGTRGRACRDAGAGPRRSGRHGATRTRRPPGRRSRARRSARGGAGDGAGAAARRATPVRGGGAGGRGAGAPAMRRMMTARMRPRRTAAGDGLPFDGGEPGPAAAAPAPGTGEPTDQ